MTKISGISTTETDISNIAWFEGEKDDGTSCKFDPGALASIEVMHVQHQQSSGTNGGTATSGSDQTRTLNTVVQNDITGASLSSNQVTLPAGTYRVQGLAPCYRTNTCRALLYNVTDAVEILRGSSRYNSSGSSVQSDCTVRGEFTIAGTKAIELRTRVFTSHATFGMGVALSIGTEVYDELWIEKVG